MSAASAVFASITRRHVVLAAPFIALVEPLRRAIDDNSFLWHVRAGTVQLSAGEVIRTDPFAFPTAGAPWRTQSWLAELAYGRLEEVTGGLRWATPMVLVALGVAGLLLLRRAAMRRTSTPVLFALGMLFVIQTYSFGVMRPVLLTYPLLAATALLVDREDDETWVMPALIWLWAALHGSFVLGIGIAVLDAVRRRDVRRGAMAGLSVLAASLTAHGLAVWEILFDFATNREALDVIEEWQPPGLLDVAVAPFMIVVVLAVVAIVRRRLRLHDAIVAVPFLAFGFLAARNVMPALIVAAPPVVVAALGGVETRRRATDAEAPAVNAALVAAVAVVLVVVASGPARLDGDRFPRPEIVAAVEGRVFADSAVGGYLIWARGPDLQVYIDDRAELHGAAGFREMASVIRGEQAAAILQSHLITEAIVRSDQPVVAELEGAGWVREVVSEPFVLLRAP